MESGARRRGSWTPPSPCGQSTSRGALGTRGSGRHRARRDVLSPLEALPPSGHSLSSANALISPTATAQSCPESAAIFPWGPRPNAATAEPASDSSAALTATGSATGSNSAAGGGRDRACSGREGTEPRDLPLVPGERDEEADAHGEPSHLRTERRAGARIRRLTQRSRLPAPGGARAPALTRLSSEERRPPGSPAPLPSGEAQVSKRRKRG